MAQPTYMLPRRPSYLAAGVGLVAFGVLCLVMLYAGHPVLPPHRGDTAPTINISLSVMLIMLGYLFLQPYLERQLFGRLVDGMEARRLRRERREAARKDAIVTRRMRVRRRGIVEHEEIGRGASVEVEREEVQGR